MTRSCHLFNLVGQVIIHYLWDHGFFSWWNWYTDPSSLYADDTAIISDSVDQLPGLIQTIYHVGSFTGLELNLSKTIAFSCSPVEDCVIAGIQVACKLVKYLGAYLGYSDLSTLNFEQPLQKARNKISCWNKRHLTLPARVTVLKTFIISIFIHVLNSVIMSNDQLHLIQNLLNDFLWKGKNHVKHSVTCAPLSDGGLNMIHVMNVVHLL